MTDAIKNELGNIVNTLVKTGIVSKIILFGPCTRGDEGPNSDIDLCVLTPIEDDEDGQRLIDVTVDFRVRLIDVRERPLDLLTYNQFEFSTHAARSRSFEHHIAEKILKAYSIAKDGTRIKEHDLEKLLRRCERHLPDFNDFTSACSILDTYISKTRYPSTKKLTVV
ncbi:MAG: HEPN domain-containing protein [Chitinispirillia bacterium]|nr:HEPN domain-containing protein [Chitinispirillia bacterium]